MPDPEELPADDDPEGDSDAAGVAVPGFAELWLGPGCEVPVPVLVDDPFAPPRFGSVPVGDVESTTGLRVPVDVVELDVPGADVLGVAVGVEALLTRAFLTARRATGVAGAAGAVGALLVTV